MALTVVERSDEIVWAHGGSLVEDRVLGGVVAGMDEIGALSFFMVARLRRGSESDSGT
ncbi:MAG: hypothetical protein JKY65_10530 [Planctomycetes bacterium]|nr:hypothetical protein [Planctomycetota bacterium]